jgi:23S rRNA pseudouridine1911/1915/1917 synthase
MKRIKLIATVEHAMKRLDQVLADWLPEALGRPVSKAKARKLIMAGAVYVNGRPVQLPSKALAPGVTVEALVEVERLFEDSTSRDRKFELTADSILFEDEDLIAVDKPPGLPAQPTLDESRDNLFAAVNRSLSNRNRIEKPYVGVHHRLDRDTSGVVLFTKSERVNAAVAETFAKHRVTKIYHALTVPRGTSGLKEWTVKNYLGNISSKSKRARYGAVKSDGKFAETSFRVFEEYPAGIWIEAIPRTGRTHQIRVHLSEYGLPILGDDLYGPNPLHSTAPRLMLHAAELIFPHPVTGRGIRIKSPLPADFQRCLNRMGR